MHEERTLVLEMLAAGKIDVVQANELLESLEPPHAASAQPAPSSATKPPSLKLNPEQIIELKNHDIDAHFIRGVQGLGLSSLSFDDILELGVHEIPPKFIRDLRELFPDIGTEQIIELHNHDIDSKFLRELQEANLLSHDPNAVLNLKEAREQEGNA